MEEVGDYGYRMRIKETHDIPASS
ncbi:MAG: hypothetical protein UY32_C0018G0012, partial [Candidatus Jorgensenbacteria bacterium GW2011_GWC1_48_8]